MLEITHLQKSYGSHEVLRDVSLTIEKGEIITVLGKNGSGKTTLLNCILRLIPFNGGTISFDGKDIRSIRQKKYFTQIGAVLESSENLYYYLTGRQNLIYFGTLYGMSKKEIEQASTQWLEQFALTDALDRRVGQYSRGMVQKLAITIAMLNDPCLLLLDEPTLGLDIFSKHQMIKTLLQSVTDKKRSIILTTHQMETVEAINSRLIFLEHGKITDYRSVSDFKMSVSNHQYQLVYKKEGEPYSEKVNMQNFEDVYHYAQAKEVDEIVEIKKQSLSLEDLLLAQEEKS